MAAHRPGASFPEDRGAGIRDGDGHTTLGLYSGVPCHRGSAVVYVTSISIKLLPLPFILTGSYGEHVGVGTGGQVGFHLLISHSPPRLSPHLSGCEGNKRLNLSFKGEENGEKDADTLKSTQRTACHLLTAPHTFPVSQRCPGLQAGVSAFPH